MLIDLTIENFAIIDRVELHLGPGLVALTGKPARENPSSLTRLAACSAIDCRPISSEREPVRRESRGSSARRGNQIFLVSSKSLAFPSTTIT